MNDKDTKILEKAIEINLNKLDKKYTYWKKTTKFNNIHKEIIPIINQNIIYIFPSRSLEIQSSRYQINEDIVPILIVEKLNWEPKKVLEFINKTKLIEERINQLIEKEFKFWEKIKNTTSLTPEKWITEFTNEIKNNFSTLQTTKGEITSKNFFWKGDGKNSILIIVSNNEKTNFDLNIEEEKISAAIFAAEILNYSPQKLKLFIGIIRETISSSTK